MNRFSWALSAVLVVLATSAHADNYVAPTYLYQAPLNYYQNAYTPLAVNGRYGVPVVYAMPRQATPTADSIKALDTRYGHLTIHGAKATQSYFYTVALNGTPIVSAPYQSYRMIVSEVFKLVDEDIVIFTVDGDANGCSVHNFMVALRSNGTFVGPAEIGDCRVKYNARMIDNGLVVEFPSATRPDRPAIWRYKYGALERI